MRPRSKLSERARKRLVSKFMRLRAVRHGPENPEIELAMIRALSRPRIPYVGYINERQRKVNAAIIEYDRHY